MRNQLFSTVCRRLTLSHTLLFGLLSLGAFVLVYVHIAHNLNKQTDDRLRASIREFSRTREEDGRYGLQEEFSREAAATGKERIFFRLLDPGGHELVTSDLSAWQKLKWSTISIPAEGEQINRLRIAEYDHPVRVITARLKDNFILQTGMRDDKDEVLESYRETFSTAFFLILIIGGIGAYIVARRAMNGVLEVTEAAGRIATGDLEQPISSGNRGEEIEALAAMFNTMQERIAGLIGELKTVINNVAHDMRMPITRMRGAAETTLTQDADKSTYRDMAVTVIEESDGLVNQINIILELAEIDAGLKIMNMEPVDLARIVGIAVELYQPAVEKRNIELTVQGITRPLSVTGNLNGLQRLLANLFDNAVKFTPAGGKITVTLASESEYTVLSIADNGPGIMAEDKEKIFDRFYRADASRSISGNGLGLSLVKAIVLKHHGTIMVDSDGHSGSSFVVRLPRK